MSRPTDEDFEEMGRERDEREARLRACKPTPRKKQQSVAFTGGWFLRLLHPSKPGVYLVTVRLPDRTRSRQLANWSGIGDEAGCLHWSVELHVPRARVTHWCVLPALPSRSMKD